MTGYEWYVDPFTTERVPVKLRLAQSAMGQLDAGVWATRHGPAFVVIKIPKAFRKDAPQLTDRRSRQRRVKDIVGATQLASSCLMEFGRTDPDMAEDVKIWFDDLSVSGLRKRVTGDAIYLEEPARTPQDVGKDKCLMVALLLDTVKSSKKICNQYVQILSVDDPHVSFNKIKGFVKEYGDLVKGQLDIMMLDANGKVVLTGKDCGTKIATKDWGTEDATFDRTGHVVIGIPSILK